MFDNLSGSLQSVFKNLRGYGKVSEKNISDAMREIRMALLEADVNYEVAKDFIKDVKEKCMGEDVLGSITPGQQITKRVHDQMVELLGKEHKGFTLNAKPAMIMMLGLHGAGKTTTTGKLAKRWTDEGKKVLVVACDIRRPAAVEQLTVLAQQAGCEVIQPNPGESVPDIGLRARDYAIREFFDIVIFDTGGRFAIDEELVAELKDLRDCVKPHNTILVVDAAIGQESVNVAQTFNTEVGITGLILTKLDGDARGGAALSIQAVTGCPIHLIGVGEKQEDLEAFHPDRIANRILGMGDVVSLVEKAQASFDMKDAASMQERMMNNQFDLQDFLTQLQMMKKMGGMGDMLKMVPGMPKMGDDQKEKMLDHGAKQTKNFEAIIQSMTIKERQKPGIINASRRKRIAKGSGTQVKDVNQLLKQFDQTRKMTKNLKKMQKRLRRMPKFT